VYLIWSLNGETDKWYEGLSGHAVEPGWEGCELRTPGVPWVAALPARTLNFFSKYYAVGFNSCPAVTPFSTVNKGVLDIKCQEDQALVIENPDYISMRNDTFVLLETGMEIWHNRTQALQRSFSVPGTTRLLTQAEWLEVHCGSNSDFHTQNVRNETIIDRLETYPHAPGLTRMNLLVIMIDTVSRAQVFRKMPATVSFLERLNATGSSEAFQFFRLFANGFATEMNTKAMYTGSLNRRERSGRPYWDIFKSQGNVALYLNGFCEDWMSTFLKKEFAGADYFAFLQWCNPEYHPIEKTFGNFAGPFSILRRCLNGRHVHRHMFDYLRQYWDNYRAW